MATKRNALVLRMHVDWLCMGVWERAAAAVGGGGGDVATINILIMIIALSS